MTDKHSSSTRITPEQVCIGMHVHLDMPWTAHPFTFSSFKVRTLEQIVTLQSLGLSTIHYDPAKSDSDPLQVAPKAPPVPVTPASHENNPLYQAKRARAERLLTQQALVAAGERKFLSSARTVKSIDQKIFAQPAQAREEAQALVQSISDSMFNDSNIAINLVKDRLGGEDMYCHSLNVTVLSLMLGKELKLPKEELIVLGLGAIFHDVGNHEIPNHILSKTGALTKPERCLLQEHVDFGGKLARKMGLSADVQSLIAQHHEYMDGSGYPKGLMGSDIHLLARIVNIADTFDYLCNRLKQAMTPHQAISLMYIQQRAKFDTDPLNTFVHCIGIYPPGTIVVLSNQCVGMVISANSSAPLKPTVLLYDRYVPRDQAILVELVELESEPEVTIARAVKPDQLPKAIYEYLSPRQQMAYYFDAKTPPLERPHPQVLLR